MRGLAKKLNGKGQRGGYKKTQRTKVLNSLVHLQNVWLNLFEFDIYGRRGSGSRRVIPEPLQERAIRIREGGQLDLDGHLPRIHNFGFRPGILFSRYLFGPGRSVALLAAKALSYDSRAQKYEKRLTRYLSWLWRIRAYQLNYLQPLRIDTVLKEIDLRIDRRFPARTLERLERALNELEADGLIRAWQYEGFAPDQHKVLWIDDWLHNTIRVEPPQIVFDRYRSISHSHRRADGQHWRSRGVRRTSQRETLTCHSVGHGCG